MIEKKHRRAALLLAGSLVLADAFGAALTTAADFGAGTEARIRVGRIAVTSSDAESAEFDGDDLGLSTAVNPAPKRDGQIAAAPGLTLAAPGSVDQDDMCIWIHPTDRSQSTVIVSDKGADRLFVYDLDGNVLQTIEIAGIPANIDIRYGFDLSGEPTDIVGYNDKANNAIALYRVDHATWKLSFIGDFASGGDEGFCLYRSPVSGKYYAFTADRFSRMVSMSRISVWGPHSRRGSSCATMARGALTW